jgi:transcriptional antiterminator RfaH
MSFWAAAQVKGQSDQVALHYLHLFGYETYAPRLLDRRVRHGRKVVKTPLFFPGYLFVLIELQWSRAMAAPGVVRLVMAGAVPAAVPEEVVSALRAQERNGLIELPPSPPRFRRGDRVRVTQGPLRGLTGMFSGLGPRDRIAVLLSMMGGRRKIDLPGDYVEPCGLIRHGGDEPPARTVP